MYLMYTGGGQYANAVRRKRKSEGGGYETIYLGRVLDRERGIVFSTSTSRQENFQNLRKTSYLSLCRIRSQSQITVRRML